MLQQERDNWMGVILYASVDDNLEKGGEDVLFEEVCMYDHKNSIDLYQKRMKNTGREIGGARSHILFVSFLSSFSSLSIIMC